MPHLNRTFRRWACPALLVLLFAPQLVARPDGFAAECGGCHYGQLEGGGVAPSPLVHAATEALRVEPGEQLDITVTVENQWPDAVVAGFLILSEQQAGVFTPSDEGTGNVGIEPGVTFPYAIGHTRARELREGTATFRASWTAPETSGSYAFSVYAVTSDDGDGMDDPDVSQELNDPFGKTSLTIGVGCDLETYYYDADNDGYGSRELLACEPPPGYVLQGGDCQDDDPAINPGAEELCSFADEDCDGEPMAPSTYFRDVDGDGYGDASDILPGLCEPPEGYVEVAGDCAPEDPAVHPGAIEIPDNGIDDNCDGHVDEVVVPSETVGDDLTLAPPAMPTPSAGPAPVGGAGAGVDLPSPGAGMPAGPELPMPTDSAPSSDATAAGCAVAPRGQQLPLVWLGVVAIFWLRRRFPPADASL